MFMAVVWAFNLFCINMPPAAAKYKHKIIELYSKSNIMQ